MSVKVRIGYIDDLSFDATEFDAEVERVNSETIAKACAEELARSTGGSLEEIAEVQVRAWVEINRDSFAFVHFDLVEGVVVSGVVSVLK